MPEFVDAGDPDHCATCGRLIGRAGRTNDELLEAIRAGTFATSFGATDYSTEPYVTTRYCGACLSRRKRQAGSSTPPGSRP